MDARAENPVFDISSRKFVVAIASALLVVVAVLASATSVSAQTGPAAGCIGSNTTSFGSNFFGLEDFGNRLLSTSPTTREFAIVTPIEAGTYVLQAVSYDGYAGRETIPAQTREQWYAEFLSADGTVLATSGVTGDIEDGVEESTWSGSLGEIVLAHTATTIRTVHAAPGSLSINSVRPVCVGATGGPDIPDSTLVVDFDSTAASGSTVTASCGDLQESATGTSVDLLIESVPAGSSCDVQYPIELLCVVAVDPAATQSASTEGVVNIAVPNPETVITVDIDCEPALVAGAVQTTTTTTPAAAAPVVTAPTAQVQDGTPAFTG
jgi:hypothetical protein